MQSSRGKSKPHTLIRASAIQKCVTSTHQFHPDKREPNRIFKVCSPSYCLLPSRNASVSFPRKALCCRGETHILAWNPHCEPAPLCVRPPMKPPSTTPSLPAGTFIARATHDPLVHSAQDWFWYHIEPVSIIQHIVFCCAQLRG